jgi:thiamine-phosphate pyrophosphorylase
MKGLLFITHRTEKYDYLQSVEIALRGGCRQIQLRMKDACVMEVEKVAVQAKALCDEYGADLYLNDHVEACLKTLTTGVHLGKMDMSPLEARTILGEKYIIGGTANTFDDILHLEKQEVNYIGLGPFRFTATKKNLSPVLGLEGYRGIVNLCRERGINLPILAVGGITVDDIPDIMQTGVSGVALSSSILNAQNPVGTTREIVDLLNR